MIKREHSVVLNEIASVLFSEELDQLALSEAITNYKRLLTEIAELHLEDEQSRNDIHLATGKAIGTSWAAMCIDDRKRTKQFVKGINNAVKVLLENEKRPVEILYAGSGPFAALILPLTTRYSAAEISIRVLEINSRSCEHLKTLINKLNLADYFTSIENVDATKYVVKSAEKVDILLSETMQRGLEKEQQVSIVVNLLKQLNEEVVLIPEKIELDLGLIEYSATDATQRSYKKLAKLFELSKKEIQKFNLSKDPSEPIRFPKQLINVAKDSIGENSQLAIFTDIQVYGREKLSLNQSGLTLPIVLHDIRTERMDDLRMRIGYEVGINPGLKYETNY